MHQDSGVDLDQEFFDELNLVVNLLKDKEGWEKFVCSLDGNPVIHELIAGDFDLSPGQIAGFMFWRLTNLSIVNDGSIRNKIDDQPPGDDDQDVSLLFSLRAWKEQVLIEEILQSNEFIGFETLSGMFDDYAPRSREESEAIWAEFEEQHAEDGCLDQIRSFPDSEIPPVLRSRPEQGLSGR